MKQRQGDFFLRVKRREKSSNLFPIMEWVLERRVSYLLEAVKVIMKRNVFWRVERLGERLQIEVREKGLRGIKRSLYVKQCAGVLNEGGTLLNKHFLYVPDVVACSILSATNTFISAPQYGLRIQI